jgi:hypothetical protein
MIVTGQRRGGRAPLVADPGASERRRTRLSTMVQKYGGLFSGRGSFLCHLRSSAFIRVP